MISIGIDVSKDKSMLCALKPYGEVVTSPYEIEHTETSVNQAISYVRTLEGKVRVVMEATGAYHLPLLARLDFLSV